jgi:hypothetical protein
MYYSIKQPERLHKRFDIFSHFGFSVLWPSPLPGTAVYFYLLPAAEGIEPSASRASAAGNK